MANAIRFVPTNLINGRKLADDSVPVYEVHLKGEFWGYVSGSKGYFRAMSQHAFSWGPHRRTRAHAVEAAKTSEMLAVSTPATPPEGSIKVHVTEHNLTDVIRVGDVVFGAEDLGPLRSIRLTNDRYRNAVVIGDNGRDVLGLPSDIYIIRPTD